jgi:hypothetical protein
MGESRVLVVMALGLIGLSVNGASAGADERFGCQVLAGYVHCDASDECQPGEMRKYSYDEPKNDSDQVTVELSTESSSAAHPMAGQFLRISSSSSSSGGRSRSWVEVSVHERQASGEAQPLLRFSALPDAIGVQKGLSGWVHAYGIHLGRKIKRVYGVICVAARDRE